MCEIRFTLNAKDGKLEQMMKSVNSGIRTEVVKEALRYFLSHVRDNKVESMYIDSTDLSRFKTNVNPNIFTIDDMMKLMEVRPMMQPTTMVVPTAQPIEQINNVNISSNNNNDNYYTEEEQDVVVEFDCDNTEVTVNEDLLNTDNMDW